MVESYLNIIQSFIILLKYIAQADGVISDEEIQYFEEFLTKIRGDDLELADIFRDIKISNLVKFEEVISQLEKIDDHNKILSIINALGIACSDKIEKSEIERIDSIIKYFKIEEEKVKLISQITGAKEILKNKKEDDLNKNILYISNNPEEADLLIRRKNFKATIFPLDSKIYFYGIDTNGKITTTEGMIFFDKIATEIKKEDSILLDKTIITYDEIKRRLKTKNENIKKKFFILSEERDNNKFFVIRSDSDSNISIKKILAEINIEGNICSIINKSNDIVIFIDEEKIENNKKVFFGIDEPITIKEKEKVNKLENIKIDIQQLLSKNINSNTFYIENRESIVKKISNHNKSADLFLENHKTEKENEFIDLEIKISKNSAMLEVKRSYLPIFVNGKRLTEDIILLDKISQILIDREIINCDFDKGMISTDFVRIERVDVKNVTYKYKGRDIALDDISFSNKYGDFVCIMGPSGCGKSTLMKLMLGYLSDFTGSIEFNGISFHKNFNILKEFVGYVPQDDLLFENLTVYENLFYAGKLKNPEISNEKLNNRINELLIELGLSEKRDLPVGNEIKRTLSGGERRRLNIGIELLNDVDVLFLDEPTSGLSSYDSKKIIDLLYNYAKKGKIIYVVIHQPSAELYYKFNKLLLLDYGGKLAYFGDTAMAIDYFNSRSIRIDDSSSCPVCKKSSPDLILNVLQEVRRDLNGNPIYTKVKNNKIPLRVKSPDVWKKIFENYRSQNEISYINGTNEADIKTILNKKKNFITKLTNRWIRFKTLFIRNFKDKLRDKVNIVMTFLVPVLLVIILSFLMRSKSLPDKIDIKKFEGSILTKVTEKEKNSISEVYEKIDDYYKIKEDINKDTEKNVLSIFKSRGWAKYLFKKNESFEKFLFLTVIIFIFLGITSSISEILKDRAKIQRERLINIKSIDYLSTKLITVLIFSFFQVLLYMLLCFTILQIPFAIPEFKYYGTPLLINFFIISFLTVAISVMLGLFFSALLKSEKSIFTIIPILIIPQIIFGGLFLNYDDMGGRIFQKDRPVPFYCDLIISRWAYEGLLITTYKFNPNNEIWIEVTNKFYKKNPDKINKIKDISNYYNENMRLKFNDYAFITIKNAEKSWRYIDFLNKRYNDKNILDFLKNFLSNRNVFPSSTKMIYHYKISTVYFNTIVLLFGTIVLFILTFLLLDRERKIKK